MNNARFEREHIDVPLSQFLCLNEKIGFAPGFGELELYGWLLSFYLFGKQSFSASGCMTVQKLWSMKHV